MHHKRKLRKPSTKSRGTLICCSLGIKVILLSDRLAVVTFYVIEKPGTRYGDARVYTEAGREQFYILICWGQSSILNAIMYVSYVVRWTARVQQAGMPAPGEPVPPVPRLRHALQVCFIKFTCGTHYYDDDSHLWQRYLLEVFLRKVYGSLVE